MNVQKGMIYGLLGPSGCGKTTLLKLLIGFLNPLSGFLSIFGCKPGSYESGVPGIGVGYMPQGIGLPYYFKVGEIFKYFGSIYLMNDEFIEKQMNYVLHLLQITDKEAILNTLSGGQKRRLSLAVAVFSEPRLLILDEPTVGVDPLLRSNIWTLLNKLVQEKRVTVIVTTHYIEEMRSVHKVAFMRNGSILKEGQPNTLLQQFNRDSLEEVFYDLCYNQEQHSRTPISGEAKEEIRIAREPLCRKSYHNCCVNNFIIMSALCRRIILGCIRHKSFAFVYILPAMVILGVFGGVGRNPTGVQIGVIIDDLPVIEDHHLGYENVTFLPHLLLRGFDENMFSFINYSNTQEAFVDAKKGNIFGFIHLKENFSRNFYERDFILNENSDYLSDEIIESGNVHFTVDISQKLLADLVIRETLETVLRFREDAFEAIGIEKNVARLPMQLAEPIHGSVAVKGYTQRTHNYTINTLLLFLFGISLATTAFSYHVDDSEENFSRIFSAGVKAHHLVIGENFIRCVIMSSVAVVNLLFVVIVLNVPCKGSLLLASLNLLLQTVCGVNFGTLFALLFPSTAYCHIFSTALILYLLTTSGAFWPNQSIPYFLQSLTSYSPVSLPITTMLRLFNYSNVEFTANVLPAFNVSIVYSLLCSLISWYLLNKSH